MRGLASERKQGFTITLIIALVLTAFAGFTPETASAVDIDDYATIETTEAKSTSPTAITAGHGHTCALLTTNNVHCWGDNLYGQSDSYAGGDATAITAGTRHTCALLTNGNVDCWGDITWGQSDDYTGGDATAVAAGDSHTCALLTNGNVDC